VSKHAYRRFWHWRLRRLEVGNAELTSSILVDVQRRPPHAGKYGLDGSRAAGRQRSGHHLHRRGDLLPVAGASRAYNRRGSGRNRIAALFQNLDQGS
jgi:hypothetical protein